MLVLQWHILDASMILLRTIICGYLIFVIVPFLLNCFLGAKTGAQEQSTAQHQSMIKFIHSCTVWKFRADLRISAHIL